LDAVGPGTVDTVVVGASGFGRASGVEEDVEATTNEVSVANHGN
jgi:hypothetical protein